MQELQLRCFLRGRADHWEGICIDLDIAVQGNSVEGVQTALREAISTYFEDLQKEQPHDARRLMRRKAPLWFRMQIIANFMLHLIFGARKSDELNAEFRIACPG